jgi:nitrate reductase cytochrome c-type subunit
MSVYCYIKDCEHRSQRPTKQLNGRNEQLYKCLLKDTIISHSSLEEYEVTGNPSFCLKCTSRYVKELEED